MAVAIRAAKGGKHSRRGDVGTYPVRRGPDAAVPAGLLAPATGLTIPRLNRVPRVYRVDSGDHDSLQLARALVSAGVAEPQDWTGDVDAFLKRTLLRWIEQGYGALQRHHGLYAVWCRNLSDLLAYGDTRDPQPGVFYLAVIADGNDPEIVRLGTTLRLVAAEDPRLAATLHWVVARALSFASPLTWRDLEWEWEARYEHHCETTGKEYDAEAAGDWHYRFVPACMSAKPYSAAQLPAKAAAVTNAAVRRLIDRVFALRDASRAIPSVVRWPDAVREELEEDDWSEPFPGYYLGFDAEDEVEGAFDMFMQSKWHDGFSDAPLELLEIDVMKPSTARLAKKWVVAAARTLGLAQQLFANLPASDDPAALANVLAGDEFDAAAGVVQRVLVRA